MSLGRKEEPLILQSALSNFFKTRAVTFRNRAAVGSAERGPGASASEKRWVGTGQGGARGREAAADSCHNKWAQSSSRLKPQQEVWAAQ